MMPPSRLDGAAGSSCTEWYIMIATPFPTNREASRKAPLRIRTRFTELFEHGAGRIRAGILLIICRPCDFDRVASCRLILVDVSGGRLNRVNIRSQVPAIRRGILVRAGRQ